MKEQVFMFRHSLLAPFIKSKFVFDEKRIEIKKPSVFLGFIKTGYDETHIKIDRISGISVEKKIGIFKFMFGIVLALMGLLSLFSSLILGLIFISLATILILEYKKYAIIISSSGEKTRIKIHKLDISSAKKMINKIKDLIE